MTIFNALTRSKLLLKEATSLNTDIDVSTLFDSLLIELEHINTFAHQLTSKTPSTAKELPEVKSGCYIFANQKAFYCPDCYDNDATKVATKRMNSKLRICPNCRTRIR